MKSIETRIQMLEKRLKVDHQVREMILVLESLEENGTYLTLPEPVEQWVPYQEALKKIQTTVFFLSL